MERVYPLDKQKEISARFNMYTTLVTRENWREHLDALSETEIIVSSWGGPILDNELLAVMPKLKIYFYGAGTIQGLMPPVAWEKGIRVTNAVTANAIPVAEFCLSQILFSLKHGWKYMQLAKTDNPQLWQCDKPVPGNFDSKVGLISLGQIARKTCELLKVFDLEVLVATNYPDDLLAEELNISFVSIEEIFKSCDVISLHLPGNDKNRNRIGKQLLESMKQDSTLINTARGSVVNQAELIEFLKERTDVTACIDVTEPEPPSTDCRLFALPNVVLTPHLAGSMGKETLRMTQYIIEEMDRYIADEPLLHEIKREALESIA